MRGLPPPPTNVARLRFEFLVNGRTASVGFWLFVPGAPAADTDWMERLLGDAILGPLEQLLALQHNGSTFSTCRLDLAGLSSVKAFAFASGVWTGGQANAIALCLHHVDGTGRRSSAAVTHVPAVPDAFVADGQRVSTIGYGNLEEHGGLLLRRLNELPDPISGFCSVVTLHRSRGGVALVPPQVSFVQQFQASPVVTTLRRRMPKRPGVSPS